MKLLSSLRFLGLAGLVATTVACSRVSPAGTTGGVGPSGGTGGAGDPGTPGTPGGSGGMPAIDPGGVTVPPKPFEAITAQASVRKVKNLLTGLTPTDADVNTVTAMGAAGLQMLINNWMTQPEFKDKFRDKMMFFFRNAFQQTGFNPVEDFKPQLLQNGGFDFGGFGGPGDDVYPRLVQNLEDSFAMTAWQLMAEGLPFSDVLTTRRYMMTTGLKSVYLEIEMPRDNQFGGGGMGTTTAFSFKVDESGTDIPLEQALDPTSANYLTFADSAPVTTVNTFGNQTTCRGTAGLVSAYTGYSRLFQVLIGFIPSTPNGAATSCQQHAARPYMTVQDVSDWQWVTTRPLDSGETQIMPYDLPTLRKTTALGLKLPRVGFYTTPAFLALWNTNDSNQHRVTANQTLLVALGESFTSADSITPFSTAGLDANHAVAGSECAGCHKSLDPLRMFWGSQLDFNDRNDFPTRAGGGVAANPRPTATGGGFAFGSVNTTGANMYDVGPLLGQVTDVSDPNQPVNRFAIAMTQKLCFFANSSACVESDPEFRRVASAFETSNYNFASLIKELMSSPLVTGETSTVTADMAGGVPVSISRRDQLCAALSNRLGKSDLCGLAVPVPSTTQAATLKIATSVPADLFSRGSEVPVTAAEATLFYSAACEMLCENIAPLVVDATNAADTVFSSADPPTAIASMVEKVMGYPPSDPLYAGVVQILTDDYNTSIAAPNKASKTNALRSTFALACEAPTTLSFGL